MRGVSFQSVLHLRLSVYAMQNKTSNQVGVATTELESNTSSRVHAKHSTSRQLQFRESFCKSVSKMFGSYALFRERIGFAKTWRVQSEHCEMVR